MARRKVGILTFHHGTNYGAVLQAMALANAVQALGHDTQIINYRLPKATRIYRRIGWRSEGPWAAGLKRLRFARFIRNHARLSGRSYNSPDQLRANPPDVDTILVGSDQVWNTRSWRGYDPTFFLGWTEGLGIRRVSYAPSVGNTTEFGERGEAITKMLSAFDYLSVRDKPSQALIAQHAGRTPEVVCDPVFLHRFDVIHDRPPIAKDYFLVYSLETTPLFKEIVSFLQQRDRDRSVSVFSPFPGIDCYYGSAGPVQWINLIHHARYVVTNSFHGICFCVLMRKPFIVPARSQHQMRITEILATVGLEDRVLADDAAFESRKNDLFSIDWEQAAQKLDAYIAASKDYLSSALA